MPYSEFTFEKAKIAFDLTIIENTTLFTNVQSVEPSSLLLQWLKDFTPLAIAINTEKSRSEFLIAPILGEVRKLAENNISLFSGVDFNVDPEKKLIGFCDYILSASPEQFYIEAPVVTIVEAKNENIKSGLGQCIAEMIAAQIFNVGKGKDISPVYGVVTSGQIWKFIKLESNYVTIDMQDYYISDVDLILGVFKQILKFKDN